MATRRPRVRLRAVRAAVCVALVATGCAGDPPGSSGCDSRIENQVKGTTSFRACSALTGLELGERLKKKDDLDPTRVKFCGSQACLDVFRQLQSIGGLYCLAPYNTATLSLDQQSGGVACFGAEAFEPPTTMPPTPDPAILTPPPSTESVPFVPPAPPVPMPNTSESSSSSDSEIATVTPVTAPVNAIARDQKASPSNVHKPDEPSQDSSTHSVILWLLVVTSSFMSIVFALACLVFYRRAMRSDSDPHEEAAYVKQAKTTREQRTASSTGRLSTDCESPVGMAASNNSQVFSCITLDSIECNDEIIASCRIPYEKLAFGEHISQGSFGEVYRGTYRGETVAIKTLLPTHRKSTHHIQNLLQEVKMLAALDHERVVRFIGVAWDSWNELSVVMEFAARGDLRSLLKEYEASDRHATGFDATKVKIALHVAHGLMYLHTLQPIVLHRDLKSRNVLLDVDFNAKITDFGVSRERSDCTMTAGVGSGLWMAPEVMMGERYDEKADVFSFGVLLSEIDLHCVPYSHARTSGADNRRLPDTTIVQMVSMGILSVAFSDEERSAVAQLGRDCVALDPAERPRAGEVLHRLHQIYQGFASSSLPQEHVRGAFV